MQLMGIHPRFPVTVTRSERPWMPAYIGQPLFRVGGHLYGGILDRVIADGVDLVEIGQAEKHPDKDWYRAIKQQQQPQQEQDDAN